MTPIDRSLCGENQPEPIAPSRRELLAGTVITAIGLNAPAAQAAEASGSFKLAPDGRSIRLHRIYTGEDNKTRVGQLILRGVPVGRNEASIVPTGCIRLAEGPAMNVVIRNATQNNTLDYHNDPPQQHQLTVAFDGACDIETKDGGSFHTAPGEITSVEDTFGSGHRSTYPHDGFLRMFIGRPANL